MTGSYHSWRPTPPPKRRWRGKPPASDGTAVMTSRQAAIADALGAEDKARIRAEAEAYAADVMAAWEGKRR